MTTYRTALPAATRAVVRQRPKNWELRTWQPATPALTANVLKLVLVAAIVTALAWLINVPHQAPLNAYLSIAWSLYLPIALVGVCGALRSRRLAVSTFSGRVGETVVFMIPTVARGDTLPALHRVVGSILHYAPRNLRNFVVHVVVDEGAEGIGAIRRTYAGDPRVEVLVVPERYSTPTGTKHKARANHYALDVRRARGLGRDDVFVYHLDDDTSIGPDTAASIAEFIAEDDGTYDLAQGILTFPHQLAASKFTVLADSVRPADDLTRFQFFTGMLGAPLSGLHGEHLLVRASVEQRVGWDFGPTKVEDAYFGLRFALDGHGKSTFLKSFSYGASPQSIGDLVKQRRRWAAGLVALLFDRSIPAVAKLPMGYAVSVWTTGFFQHVGLALLIAFATGTPGTSPVASWIVPLWSMGLAYLLWAYLEGLRVNLQASGKQHLYLRYAVATVPGLLVFAAVEGWAALLGVKDAVTGNHDFAVISKQR